MAIDFPATPSNGQTYVVGSVTYTYDGTKWTAVAAGGGGGSGDIIIEGNTSAEVIDTGSDGRFVVTTEGSERARIDSSGRLLVGTSTSISTLIPAGLQVQNTGANAYASIGRWDNNVASGGLIFTKSRGGSVGTRGAVQNGDILGEIYFTGDDGTNFVAGANILAAVESTPGTNDMPTRLVFSTTADGASSPTERMRITSAGYLRASNDGNYRGNSHHEFSNTANDNTLVIRAMNTGYTDQSLIVGCTRSADSLYYLASFYSGNGSTNAFGDREFGFRGDGNGYCDGSWTGGGADYAEYFEWSDSNLAAEDRRGISVVLDGNKIRPAVAGEDPIGVISGNPSVVGDAAWNKWNGKYLRDEYGTYIQEDYEVTNDDGNTVIQQRRKLNPAYDPDVEYTSREERPEWDCVGLMGKLRIRKGQPTGSRWIKMRDISATVEEWLVR